MPFSFSPSDSIVCYAEEFLRAYPQCGRTFSLPRLGLTFYALRNCLCLGPNWQAILPIMKDGVLPYIFKESCPYPANEHQLAPIVARHIMAPAVDIDEAAPFYPAGSENFWHWTVESLPKLLALELTGYTGQYIIPHGNSIARKSLVMFGIAEERLLPDNAVYKVARLLLPPRLPGFDLATNMPLTDFLRQNILDAVGVIDGDKHSYIHRIGTRKIVNEGEILRVLEDFDFETMIPEELSMKDQFHHMTAVTCSVMAHGANSTLSLLQKHNSVFVEFFGHRYVSYTNLHAVRLLQLRYHALVEELNISCCPNATISAVRYLEEGLKADILVDPTHLRILLENALSR